MPQLVTFRGRPVKRRTRTTACGLRLVLFHPHHGFRGDRLIVSQDEWEQFGRIEFFPDDQMPDVRALAAKA